MTLSTLALCHYLPKANVCVWIKTGHDWVRSGIPYTAYADYLLPHTRPTSIFIQCDEQVSSYIEFAIKQQRYILPDDLQERHFCLSAKGLGTHLPTTIYLLSYSTILAYTMPMSIQSVDN